MTPPPPPPPPLKDAAGAARNFIESSGARRLLVLLFSLMMGTLGVVLMHQWKVRQERVLERQRQQLLSNYQEPIDIIIASKDIPQGTTIDASYLMTTAIPQKFVQPYSVRAPGEVTGMVTVAPIAASEQILKNKLRRPEVAPSEATLSTMTPKGKRAVTIAVDTITGVGGFVRPGDKVDLLWTLKLPGSNQQEDQVATLTLFQDVPVLAVGTDVMGHPTGPKRADQSAAPSASSQPQQYTVTLALSPQETSSLLFAREQGRIQLSLRPKQESGEVPIPPANISSLLESQLGVKTAQPPTVTHHVEIFKGLKRDVIALADEE